MWSPHSAEDSDARRAQGPGGGLGDVSTVVCLFCKASVHFAGLPAVRYKEHLFKEHNILFDVEAIVDRTLNLQKLGREVKSRQGSCCSCPSPKLTLDVASQTDLGRCSPIRLLPSVASPGGDEGKEAINRLRLDESAQDDAGPDGDDQRDVKVPIEQLQILTASSSTAKSNKQKPLVLPWFAGCEYQCQICHLVFYYVEDLRDHVIRSHCPADDYLDRFKQFETKNVSLKCKLCSKMVKRNYYAFKNHLEDWHSTTLLNYETQFKLKSYKVAHAKMVDGEGALLNDGRQPVVKLPAPGQVKKPRLEDSATKRKLSPQAGPREEEPRSKRSASCTVPLTPVKEPNLHDPREGRDDAANWKCAVCAELVESREPAAISSHVELVHSFSMDVYNLVFDRRRRLQVVLDAETRAAIDEEHDPARSHVYGEWKKGTCSFECSLCGHRTSDSRTFWMHVRSRHALARSEYVAAHGQPKGALNKFACPICFKVMLHEPSAMSRHARDAHGFSLFKLYNRLKVGEKGKASKVKCKKKKAQTSVAFEEWKKSFRYRCKICHYRFPLFRKTAVYSHAREAHGLSESEYGTAVVAKHKCRVCGRAVSQLGYCVSKHLNGEHGIALPHYFDTYIREKESDSVQTKSSTKQKKKTGKVDRHEKGRYVPWADQCVYRCRICQREMRNYKTFSSHLGAMHSKSMRDYKVEYREIMTEKKTHSCALCGRSVLHNASTLATHLHSAHELTLEQYHRDHILAQQPAEAELVGAQERISRWIGRCSYRCEECSAFECVDRAAFKRHLRDCHDLVPGVYVERHGRLECAREFLRCALCHEDVLRDETVFGKHCAKSHESSLEEYFHRFVANADSPNDQFDTPAVDGDEAIAFDLALGQDEDGLEREREPDRVEEDADDEWMNGCTFMCKICDEKLLSRQSFRLHLTEAHNMMEYRAYERLHGDPMTIMSMFKCACCAKLLMRDAEDIELHLRAEHEMTLAEYYKQFLQTSPDMPTIVSCSTVKDLGVPEGASFQWNRCVRVCRVCQKYYSCVSSLKVHLRQAHRLGLGEHAKLYPDLGRDVVRQYACQLCFTNITFEFRPVRDHMMSNHKLTVNDYEKLFESHLSSEISDTRDTIPANTLVLNSKEMDKELHIKKESKQDREEIFRD